MFLAMPTIEALRAIDGYKVVFEACLCFVTGRTAFKWTCMPFCVASHDDGEKRVAWDDFLSRELRRGFGPNQHRTPYDIDPADLKEMISSDLLRARISSPSVFKTRPNKEDRTTS
jgi:hypothetical protein